MGCKQCHITAFFSKITCYGCTGFSFEDVINTAHPIDRDASIAGGYQDFIHVHNCFFLRYVGLVEESKGIFCHEILQLFRVQLQTFYQIQRISVTLDREVSRKHHSLVAILAREELLDLRSNRSEEHTSELQSRQ